MTVLAHPGCTVVDCALVVGSLRLKGIYMLSYLEAYVCSHKSLWALAWLISCSDSHWWCYERSDVRWDGTAGMREALLKDHVSTFLVLDRKSVV